MEIAELKKQIIDRNFDNFYIFAGEEGYVMKTYIDQIKKRFGGRVEYVDAVSEVWGKIGAKSILSEPTVYVVMDDTVFIRADYEDMWKAAPGRVKDDILILQYTKVDKRIKFWKFYKDRAVFFDYLDKRMLTMQIQKKLNIMDDGCGLLIDACENDLGRILLEVDKIRVHCRESGLSPDRALLGMLSYGDIYTPPKDAIFDFVAAVMDRRNKSKIYELLEQCYAIGEANMVIITVLYNNLINLLQVQTCDSSSVSKSTGLTGFQIKLVKPYIDNYSDDEIIYALRLLHKCEYGIKTGLIRDEFTVNYVLAKIL